jgi:hypothetical protein
MAGNFLKYPGSLTANDLPVDAHGLIALCAPRPVFISNGSQQVESGWVDAKAMFLGVVGTGCFQSRAAPRAPLSVPERPTACLGSSRQAFTCSPRETW